MDRVRSSRIVVVCVLLLLMIFTSSIVAEKESSNDESEVRKKPITASLTERLTANLDNLKTLLKNAQTYFFPPNLETALVEIYTNVLGSCLRNTRSFSFRGGEGGISGGGGEKGAAARSFEKGVETVEGSAKTAAKIAEETVKKAKDTLHKTFSKDHHNHNHQHQQPDEL